MPSSLSSDRMKGGPGPVNSLGSLSTLSNDLWKKAWNKLQEAEPKLAHDYRERLPRSLATLDEPCQRPDAVKEEIHAHQQKQYDQAIKLLRKRSGRTDKFIELAQGLVKFVQWGSDLVSAAVSTQPYASLAWVGVSLLLPVS